MNICVPVAVLLLTENVHRPGRPTFDPLTRSTSEPM